MSEKKADSLTAVEIDWLRDMYRRIIEGPARAEYVAIAIKGQRVLDDMEAIRKDRDAWRMAVESLTPGGSEFFNDPNRCADHIRQKTNWPRQIVDLKAERLALQRQCEALRAALGPFARAGAELRRRMEDSPLSTTAPTDGVSIQFRWLEWVNRVEVGDLLRAECPTPKDNNQHGQG